tara:strand:+ start:471 stop:719 length:249 start_codon:yes stop_codon:yes gene_type:complete
MPLLLIGTIVIFGSGVIILRYFITYHCKTERPNLNPYIIAPIPQLLPNHISSNTLNNQQVPPKYEDIVTSPPEHPPSYETQP